jgi:hypothetical protein
MPTFNPMPVASILRKLFITCPLPSANADPEAALRVFFEHLDGHYTEAIVAAANKFMIGDVVGYNPAFAPTVPQFLTVVRRIEDEQARLQSLHTQAVRQLEDRRADEAFQASKDPESMKRVAELAKLQAMNLSPESKPPTPEELAKRKEAMEKHDQFFADDFVEQPNGIKVSKYLLKTLNYEVGYERED